MAELFNRFTFLKSAATLAQCPTDAGIEVAFVGRSNAGKSSAINAIVGRQRLAHTSKTPGRTQLINFFQIDEDDDRRLVDLPGYGYAKVPERVKQKIEQMLGEYLYQRTSLHGVVLLMDIRHPMTPADQQMLDILCEAGKYVHILLTKCDKIRRGPANAQVLSVRHATQNLKGVTVQSFSALKLVGVEQAQDVLLDWFSFNDEES